MVYEEKRVDGERRGWRENEEDKGIKYMVMKGDLVDEHKIE